MSCKRSRLTLESSGSAAFMTGVLSQSAKMVSCSQWRLSVSQILFSHMQMIKMTTMSRMWRKKLVVLHKVGSLCIHVARATTHSMRFKSIIRMLRLTSQRISSCNVAPLRMSSRVFQIMLSRVLQPFTLWARSSVTTTPTISSIANKLSIDVTMPLLWLPLTGVDQIKCSVERRDL